MPNNRRRVWLSLAALLVAALVVTIAAACDDDSSPGAAAAPRGNGKPATASAAPALETCRSRSEGDFGPRPFRDPANLVVGPLAIVGGAEFTPPGVVRKFGGQKHPILVRAGHTVTIRVPHPARTAARLGYGPLPQGEVEVTDGHVAVTFSACAAGEPAFSTDGTVGGFTFWSGFVLADAPACVPLDIYVDDSKRPRRAVLELGVRPCTDSEA